VHVHPGADELGRVYHPHLAINATPTAFCAALDSLQPPKEIGWRGESDAAHADFLAWGEKRPLVPGAVNLGEIMVWLREQFAGRRDHHAGRRQLLRLGPSLLPGTQIWRTGGRDLGLDGVRPAGRAGDADALSRIALLSALPATATSS
jgi:hypothetical protein